MGDRMNQARKVPPLERLGSDVAQSLEKARTGSREREFATSRVRQKIVEREVPTFRAKGRLRTGRIAGVLALAASVAFVSWFANDRHEKSLREAAEAKANATPLTFSVKGSDQGTNPALGEVGQFIAAPPSEHVGLAFSDGSEVDLAPRARARVAALNAKGARVLVESGTVHVAVVHREQTQWSIEAGPYEVRVTGTKFDVGFDPADESIVVKLEEGSVLVSGCGSAEPRRVVAGEEMRASCKAKPESTLTPAALPDAPEQSPTTAAPVDIVAAAPVATAEPAPKAEAPKPAPTSDQVTDLARKGSHAEAIAAAEARGFDTTCDALSAADLLLLADAARYAGRFDRATQALEAVRRRFSGSDAAATAAFELGRISFDVKREFKSAGDWFDTYLRERPTGGLAREALGRGLEARNRSNDPRAHDLATRYLAAYPEGPHAKLARKIQTGSQ